MARINGQLDKKCVGCDQQNFWPWLFSRFASSIPEQMPCSFISFFSPNNFYTYYALQKYFHILDENILLSFFTAETSYHGIKLLTFDRCHQTPPRRSSKDPTTDRWAFLFMLSTSRYCPKRKETIFKVWQKESLSSWFIFFCLRRNNFPDLEIYLQTPRVCSW